MTTKQTPQDANEATICAWLPIETAPKGGRILLGFSRPVFTGISAIFGKWDTDEYAKKPRPYWAHDLCNLTGKDGARANAPTHWMPNIEAPNNKLTGH